MNRVLPAEGAVLVQLQTVGSVLLVLVGVVVPLLALGAAQSDLHPVAGLRHVRHLLHCLTARSKKAGHSPWAESSNVKAHRLRPLCYVTVRIRHACLPMSAQ